MLSAYRAVQVKQLGELGLMGVAIDTDSGGAGLDYLVSVSLTQSLFRCRAAVS